VRIYSLLHKTRFTSLRKKRQTALQGLKPQGECSTYGGVETPPFRFSAECYFAFAGALAPSRINFVSVAESKSLICLNRTQPLPMLALGSAFL
jgi:hypothetical protein